MMLASGLESQSADDLINFFQNQSNQHYFDHLEMIANRANPKRSALNNSITTTQTLNTLSGKFSPMERVFLTANGNLQRIMSSYHNLPIQVSILYNIQIDDPELNSVSEDLIAYIREVDIGVPTKLLVNAKSKVIITCPTSIKLIRDDGVGIGQLFRYLKAIPDFSILDVGRNTETNALYRTYTLTTTGVYCEITEFLVPDIFDPII